MTHKEQPWIWSQSCEEAFGTLQEKFCDETVISYYDPCKAVTVQVDASPVGLGAILSQDDDKVVCYGSRALTPVESRYSQTEREALGVVWACEYFDLYLRGLPHFIVITDHKPLETIWKKPNPPLRIDRWGLCLQPYSFTIKYHLGIENIADYISRHSLDENQKSQEEDLAERYVNFITETSLLRAFDLCNYTKSNFLH